MKPSSVAIISTLCYADLFDFPLTSEEIHRYLISPKPVSQAAFTRSLVSLQKSRHIASQSGYYFLPGRSRLVSLRLKRQLISKKKLVHAQKAIAKLKTIPFISAIFLTGTLSMNNASSSDDIDLFIVTKPSRLWLARLLVLRTLHQLGKRRTPTSTNVTNLICPNLFLDESMLTLPPSKQNLYTAHEVIQVLPLYDSAHVYHYFLSANLWIKSYLPHSLPDPLLEPTLPLTSPSILLDLTEKFAYAAQRLKMRPRQTRETVTPHSAYFHPLPTDHSILKGYQDRLVVYLKKD